MKLELKLKLKLELWLELELEQTAGSQRFRLIKRAFVKIGLSIFWKALKVGTYTSLHAGSTKPGSIDRFAKKISIKLIKANKSKDATASAAAAAEDTFKL